MQNDTKSQPAGVIGGTKTCSKCKSEKPLSDFSQKTVVCKPCAARVSAEWRAANPDRFKAASTKWRLANLDKINERNRNVRARSREEKASRVPEHHPVSKGVSKFKDITGHRFTELTVVRYLGSSMWECKCDCGGVSRVHTRSLNSGNSKRCPGHNLPLDTGTMSRLYNVWRGMLKRCGNPKHPQYSHYGGAGISVCSEWEDYKVFRAWALGAGYVDQYGVSRKDQLTIDRIDNYKGYSPDNCRWVKPVVQARNKKIPAVAVEAFGQIKYVSDWALSPVCKVSERTLRNRLSLGYPAEYAMTASHSEAMSKLNPHKRPRDGRRMSVTLAASPLGGINNG